MEREENKRLRIPVIDSTGDQVVPLWDETYPAIMRFDRVPTEIDATGWAEAAFEPKMIRIESWGAFGHGNVKF